MSCLASAQRKVHIRSPESFSPRGSERLRSRYPDVRIAAQVRRPRVLRLSFPDFPLTASFGLSFELPPKFATQ